VKTLYFDAFSGISGDMTVGALIALGVPLERLRSELAKLPLAGYSIEAMPRFVNGIGAVKFDVVVEGVSSPPIDRAVDPGTQHHAHHEHARHHAHPQDPPSSRGLEHDAHAEHHGHRAYREIREMIAAAGIDAAAKRIALAIFAKLASAEGQVHGVEPDDVRFHEVGAIDSIVDIVGAAIGFADLGIERFVVGTIPLGSGVVRSQHGPIPVPAPATAALLTGFVTRPNDGVGELVTPTGAAILATLAEQAELGDFRIDAIGYGAGSKVFADRPNLLRLLLGESLAAAGAATRAAVGHDEVVLIETNIDDASPEIYEHVFERLFAAGAKDVFLTPIVMKKGRPATQLSLLCAAVDRDRLAAIVFAETTAIGLRHATMRRLVLPREVREVATEFGVVRVKVATAPDGSVNVAPEYEDCRRVATERGVALKQIYQAALVAALRA